jgi:hypothetical protein
LCFDCLQNYSLNKIKQQADIESTISYTSTLIKKSLIYLCAMFSAREIAVSSAPQPEKGSKALSCQHLTIVD